MRAPDLALAGPAARLDPRSKLVAIAVGAAATVAYSDWGSLLIIAAALGVFLIWARLARDWLKVLRSIWLLAAIVFAADELYYGVLGGAMAVVKLVLLVSFFSCFFLSTDPDDLALALTTLKVPFTFAFILAASANYVPLVMQEAREISDAFQARGLSRGRSPLELLRFYSAILVPLVVATIRRSLRLSEALEARAFGVTKRPTSIRDLQPTRRDAAVIGLSLGAFAALLIAHVQW